MYKEIKGKRTKSYCRWSPHVLHTYADHFRILYSQTDSCLDTLSRTCKIHEPEIEGNPE